VPALFLGLAMSHVVRIPADTPNMLELGEPLLFKFASWLLWGAQPDGYSLNMHPVAFAAWFGLLATALNLFPIGQLDGGHISYAVLGSRSTVVTFAMMVVAVTCAFLDELIVGLLIVVMLAMFGPRHPRVRRACAGRTRLLLALFAVVMFVLCHGGADPADGTH
jgi:membrane-associated protease RseP (regulator of RpoE activity)